MQGRELPHSLLLDGSLFKAPHSSLMVHCTPKAVFCCLLNAGWLPMKMGPKKMKRIYVGIVHAHTPDPM